MVTLGFALLYSKAHLDMAGLTNVEPAPKSLMVVPDAVPVPVVVVAAVCDPDPHPATANASDAIKSPDLLMLFINETSSSSTCRAVVKALLSFITTLARKLAVADSRPAELRKPGLS